MRPGSAHIRSPDVLTRFRHKFIAFSDRARSALELVSGDLSSVGEWLRREQLPHWKRHLRRCEDEVKQTWRDYINAHYGDRRMGKPSSVDERKAWERAKRRKEEAEEKILVVERWIGALDQVASRIMPPLKKLETLLDTLAPEAIGRLDHMLDRLDEYLRPAGGAPSPGPGAAPAPAAPPKEGPDAPHQPA